MAKTVRKWITWYIIVAMLVIGITPRVYAGFSPSEVMGLPAAERSVDLHKIQKFLEMKMVRERLQEYGLTQEEIQSRLGQLSDEQIHQVALKLDDLKVAGDSGLGILIAVLVIIVLVIIIIQLLGHRIVIK